MPRVLLLLLAGAVLTTLAGCDGGEVPGAPTSTPQVTTAAHRAAAAYLLRADQLVGYKKDGAQGVAPNTLADQENLPSLSSEVRRQGFETGARERFVDPARGGPPLPFSTIFSQALFFHDPAGAAAFFAAERGRRGVQPSSGTLVPLTALPATGAEQFAAFEVDAPASAATGGAQRAFFALMRRQNLVVSVFSQGDPPGASADAFRSLVVSQEKQLQQPL